MPRDQAVRIAADGKALRLQGLQPRHDDRSGTIEVYTGHILFY